MRKFTFQELEHFESLDIDVPIVAICPPFHEVRMKALKSLLLAKKAEFLFLGNVLDIQQSCKQFRVSLDLLFGALDPNDNFELDKMVAHLQKTDQELSRKEAILKLKNPSQIAEVLVDWQRIDGILD
jgi:phosphotransacetylase